MCEYVSEIKDHINIMSDIPHCLAKQCIAILFVDNIIASYGVWKSRRITAAFAFGSPVTVKNA